MHTTVLLSHQPFSHSLPRLASAPIAPSFLPTLVSPSYPDAITGPHQDLDTPLPGGWPCFTQTPLLTLHSDPRVNFPACQDWEGGGEGTMGLERHLLNTLISVKQIQSLPLKPGLNMENNKEED